MGFRGTTCSRRCRRRGELTDQSIANTTAESARPRRINDQSPASRPKSRATVIARGEVPAATSGFLKATGTVFGSPIFIALFPDPSMLRNTRGYFQSEL